MYSTRNYLRSFEVTLSILVGFNLRKVTLYTVYMFDASPINEIFQSAQGLIQTLNSLIPFTERNSPSHHKLEDLISSVHDDSYISFYHINSFKIK